MFSHKRNTFLINEAVGKIYVPEMILLDREESPPDLHFVSLLASIFATCFVLAMLPITYGKGGF